MLASSPVVAVVAVKDLDRAQEFYGGTLGLQPAPETDPGGVLYACGGGTQLLVYTSGYAGTNQATAASWQVDDLEGTIADLKSKGITFEQYDNIPGLERDGEIHRSGSIAGAWFKDPDGNILNVLSRG
jgi:catechol 2,3-dioxygenase-like lactoylglutathione lyase family enzyme